MEMPAVTYVNQVIRQLKSWGITKDKINDIYDTSEFMNDELSLMQIRNLDQIVIYMIQKMYDFQEIKTLISMLKRNKGNEIIELIKGAQI